MSDLTVLVDDTGTHTATLVCLNLDGSPAAGVDIHYATDNPNVATIDPTSGVLTLVGIGTTTVTGSGSRGAFSHSDSGALNVTADAATGDFTAALTLA